MVLLPIIRHEFRVSSMQFHLKIGKYLPFTTLAFAWWSPSVLRVRGFEVFRAQRQRIMCPALCDVLTLYKDNTWHKISIVNQWFVKFWWFELYNFWLGVWPCLVSVWCDVIIITSVFVCFIMISCNRLRHRTVSTGYTPSIVSLF